MKTFTEHYNIILQVGITAFVWLVVIAGGVLSFNLYRKNATLSHIDTLTQATPELCEMEVGDNYSPQYVHCLGEEGKAGLTLVSLNWKSLAFAQDCMEGLAPLKETAGIKLSQVLSCTRASLLVDSSDVDMEFLPPRKPLYDDRLPL
ncbi:MAG: hypothetical protein OXF66_06055 [Gammaproteobacteria bacterium]|nr:hypothetical protein [Gammaproteobacteria bacterium]